MSDQFTSVQWDRDEGEATTDRPQVSTTIAESIKEEDDASSTYNDSGHDKHGDGDQDDGTESDQSGLLKLPEETKTKNDESTADVVKPSTSEDNRDTNLAGSGLLPVVGSLDHNGNDKENEPLLSQLPSEDVSQSQSPPKPLITQPKPQLASVTAVHEEPEVDNYFIKTTVSNSLTEYDGQNPFTSYLISVNTNNPKLKETKFQMRKRYSDFYFLYECLLNDYPTLVIPPLPNKQRLEYIKGGRFTEEFTEKRAISLNNFLQRIAKHPILKHSQVFHVFLENPDYWMTYKSNLKISSNTLDTSNSASQNLETFTDFIMNSFKRPSLESSHQREFNDIQEKTAKLQENLNKIDGIYSKVLHKQQNLSEDFSKFGDEVSKLTILLNNDFDGKYRLDDEILDSKTKEISSQFKSFSSNLKTLAERMYNLNHNIEYNYLTSLKDLEHYISQLKNLIKIKDEKALDYEMLCNYQEKAKQEKDHLMHGGSITSTAEGTLSLITRKLGNFTGLGLPNGNGNLESDRIAELDSKIQILENEKKNAKNVYDKYEADIINEFQLFEKIKNDEITDSLKNLNGAYLEYYNSLIKDWKDLHVSTHTNVFNSKLSENDELFTNNDVLKNNELLNESLDKLKERTAAVNAANASTLSTTSSPEQ